MAPSLGGVYLKREHQIYVDPYEFFERTVLTREMIEVIKEVGTALSGKRGRLILLNSLFGGGKTHTMLSIYHAVSRPPALRKASVDETLREDLSLLKDILSGLKDVQIVVIDGHVSATAPSPLEPLKEGNVTIRTLWGYLAYKLGVFPRYLNYEENLTPPAVDKIIEMFESRPTLVLIDEISNYVKRLADSSNEDLRKYSEQVITFLENFAKAIESSPHAVAIISVPKEEGETESHYREIVSRINKAVGRIALPYAPVKPDDLPRILKVRLFKEIDLGAVNEVVGKYYDLVTKHVDEFGGSTAWVNEINSTYPFHPDYIDVIKTIIENHKGLQKTRDALRISRIVVRELFKRREKTSLVMPYHIDPSIGGLEGTLFRGELEAFSRVFNEDVLKRASECDEPELAQRIAKYVFAKTFTISHAILSKPTILPSKYDVVRATYEVISSDLNRWEPSKYLQTLEWLYEKLGYLYEKDGRYYFRVIGDIRKLIEEEARNVSRDEALQQLLDEIEKRYVDSPPSNVRSKPRRARGQRALFEDVIVKKRLEDWDIDERKYVLWIVLEKPSKGELEQLMFRVGNGIRRYSNSIYVLYPGNTERIERTLETMKKRIGCERLKGRLKESFANLDEADFKAIEMKLKLTCDKIEQELITNTYSSLNEVAYPTRSEDLISNRVDASEIKITNYSIVENAERALYDVGKLLSAKYGSEVSLEVIKDYLEQLRVSIIGKTIGEIVDYFYANPTLPAIPKDEVIKAFEEESDLICGNEIYTKIFKVVEERCSKGQCNRIREITFDGTKVGENCRVTTPVEILRYLIESWNPFGENMLEELEIDKGSIVERVKYYARVEGETIELKSLESVIEDIEYLSSPIEIVRRVEEIEKGVRISNVEVPKAVKPGEETEIAIELENVGEFEGEVRITSNEGRVVPDKVTFNKPGERKTAKLILRVPEMEGIRTVEIKVLYNGNELKKVVEIPVKGIEEDWNEGVPNKAKEVILKAENDLKPLFILLNKLGNWKATRFTLNAENDESEMRIGLRNSPTTQVKAVSEFVLKSFRPKSISYEIELRGDGPTELKFEEDERKTLGKFYVRYR
ncbi:hypothetical protein EYM_01185 [Ignicoccus islandicus DSM 13165]|uniref:ATPase AAA n=1 Tax=Ignicoccus islandicus DSM 13165 TaxID=940295 RepID=A0A0U3F834_9CREN|nr:DUF499 domain-containing protein [Ignicoccus islandicus]ALU12184.1 hypothetical protein EYM_01185 [Ignicoccus islandicus DSM 13165]